METPILPKEKVVAERVPERPVVVEEIKHIEHEIPTLEEDLRYLGRSFLINHLYKRFQEIEILTKDN